MNEHTSLSIETAGISFVSYSKTSNNCFSITEFEGDCGFVGVAEAGVDPQIIQLNQPKHLENQNHKINNKFQQ